jgi:hypothetical protein
MLGIQVEAASRGNAAVHAYYIVQRYIITAEFFIEKQQKSFDFHENRSAVNQYLNRHAAACETCLWQKSKDPLALRDYQYRRSAGGESSSVDAPGEK